MHDRCGLLQVLSSSFFLGELRFVVMSLVVSVGGHLQGEWRGRICYGTVDNLFPFVVKVWI